MSQDLNPSHVRLWSSSFIGHTKDKVLCFLFMFLVLRNYVYVSCVAIENSRNKCTQLQSVAASNRNGVSIETWSRSRDESREPFCESGARTRRFKVSSRSRTLQVSRFSILQRNGRL